MAVTMSPTTNIPRRIDVRVVGKATAPTPKGLPMSLFPLDMPAARASDAGIGRAYHGNQNADHRCKQLDSASKVTPSPLLPTRQPFRVLQTDSSTRLPSYEHGPFGFTGKNLSLMCDGKPVNPIALLIGFPLFRSFQNRPQVWPLVPITACHAGSDSDITADPFCRCLYLRQGHGHTHPCVPLPILPEDLCRFVQRRAGQGEGAIDRSVPVSRDIEPAVLAPARRCPPQHDPQIKPLGLAGLLHFGTVDQLRLECTRRMSSLGGSAVVDKSTPIGSPDELTHALCAGEPSPFLRKKMCGIGMRVLEEGRQKRERVGLVRGRVELQFVTEIHCQCHTTCIANRPEKTRTPPQERRRVSAGQSAYERLPETARREPMQNALRPRSGLAF